MTIADTHLAIQTLLLQVPLRSLAPEVSVQEDSLFLSGVVPFFKGEDGQYHYYLVRPEARKPELPPPALQIAKGTRMVERGGVWVDLTREDMPLGANKKVEPLMVTALREAEEEAGLCFDNISALYALGVFDFTSVSKGHTKHMYLAAGEVKDREAFKAPSEHGKTDSRQWCALDGSADIRDDHLQVLKQVERMLKGAAR